MRRHNAKNEIIALEASNMHKKYISKKKLKCSVQFGNHGVMMTSPISCTKLVVTVYM